MKNRQGFSIIELALVIVTLAVLGGVGYMAYNNFLAPKVADSTNTSTSTTPVKIESKADLNTASTSLDNVSLDDSDSAQLDSALNGFN